MENGKLGVPTGVLQSLETPCYYYDTGLLDETLDVVNALAGPYDYHVHYAVKANANARILQQIAQKNFGADCVSGGEIDAALQAGFPAEKIVFAGVGKADWEIKLALEAGIFCFNVESLPELEVINELATACRKTAAVALRINPNIEANTHHYITTGLQENKFGISLLEVEEIITHLKSLPHVALTGIHFHIGSQITDMDAFRSLCLRVNEVQNRLESLAVPVQHVNVGGGLGINYHEPDKAAVPNFSEYFGLFKQFLELRPHQQLHFELGRALVAQCGSLITQVLYVKKGINTDFVIVDAGMTDLLRPALYQAFHKIENLTSALPDKRYDVVGPICESSDCFGKALLLPETKRGDRLAIRSAGAYGEIMASQYNLRQLPRHYYSSDF